MPNWGCHAGQLCFATHCATLGSAHAVATMRQCLQLLLPLCRSHPLPHILAHLPQSATLCVQHQPIQLGGGLDLVTGTQLCHVLPHRPLQGHNWVHVDACDAVQHSECPGQHLSVRPAVQGAREGPCPSRAAPSGIGSMSATFLASVQSYCGAYMPATCYVWLCRVPKHVWPAGACPEAKLPQEKKPAAICHE